MHAGNLIFSLEAERNSANAVHSKRSWWHRNLGPGRRDIRDFGYCFECVLLADIAVRSAFELGRSHVAEMPFGGQP